MRAGRNAVGCPQQNYISTDRAPIVIVCARTTEMVGALISLFLIE